MRISQRGLYALQALTVLAEHPGGVVKIKDIASEDDLPEKFLEETHAVATNGVFQARDNFGDLTKTPPAAYYRLKIQ